MPGMLDWPREWARERSEAPVWYEPGSNICLDFHGDPVAAGLVV